MPSIPRQHFDERFCYIHAGTHKTGTTSIQAFLAINRERFAGDGVLIPRAACEAHEHMAAHHGIPRELCGSSFDVGALGALSDELAASDLDTACISSEDFSLLSRRPEALIQIRAAIQRSGFTPRIIMYLRPQVQYVARVYTENVRHGFRQSFADYLRDVLQTGAYIWNNELGMPFDYSLLLDTFANVFGPGTIIAERYNAGASNETLLHAFARTILPLEASSRDYELPAARLNVSPTFGNVLRALNIEADVDPGLRFAPFDLPTIIALAAHFHAPNIRLQSKYGVKVRACEPIDYLQALPIRASLARTRSLRTARQKLHAASTASHVEKNEALRVFRITA